MSKIAISLDSACDLTKELIEKYDFKIIPFGVTMGDRFFYDGEVDTSNMPTKIRHYRKPTP